MKPMTDKESQEFRNSETYLEAFQKYVEDFDRREEGLDGLDGGTLMTRLAKRHKEKEVNKDDDKLKAETEMDDRIKGEAEAMRHYSKKRRKATWRDIKEKKVKAVDHWKEITTSKNQIRFSQCIIIVNIINIIQYH